MKKMTRLFNVLIIAALFLGACNLPSADEGQTASTTAAAQTVEAMLSVTPASIAVIPSSTVPPLPPTLTPVPPPVNTNTPAVTATSNCNVAQFISDPTVPDGTIMTPGQAFVKKWRIKNIGSCTWSGFSLVFDSGDSMGAPATKAISDVGPGQEIDLEVSLTAPSTNGNYRGYFRINTNGGVTIPIINGSNGKTFYVDIKVQTPVTATFTLPAPVVFSVTSVNYTASLFTNGAYVNCPSITANITASAAGDVTYHWINAPGTPGDVKTLHFDAAGTKASEANQWYVGPLAPGPLWVAIYIDTPNHQEFAHFTVSPCTGYP
ncbi:MAG: hypothetical protein HY864_11775 [Chloroflexi bacterium]|nr:hypothetical protein [Chloroflexota bacterium]